VYSSPGSLDSKVMNTLGSHDSKVVSTPRGSLDFPIANTLGSGLQIRIAHRIRQILLGMSNGTRINCLMKKPKKKSRDTVPLNRLKWMPGGLNIPIPRMLWSAVSLGRNCRNFQRVLLPVHAKSAPGKSERRCGGCNF
jgi:hypothetical protein